MIYSINVPIRAIICCYMTLSSGEAYLCHLITVVRYVCLEVCLLNIKHNSKMGHQGYISAILVFICGFLYVATGRLVYFIRVLYFLVFQISIVNEDLLCTDYYLCSM